jgi:hypothetical protein
MYRLLAIGIPVAIFWTAVLVTKGMSRWASQSVFFFAGAAAGAIDWWYFIH